MADHLFDVCGLKGGHFSSFLFVSLLPKLSSFYQEKVWKVFLLPLLAWTTEFPHNSLTTRRGPIFLSKEEVIVCAVSIGGIHLGINYSVLNKMK